MNKYLVFAGSQYYPGCGWNDCIGSFDTKEECYEALKGKQSWPYSNSWSCKYNWWQIIDRDCGAIVEENWEGSSRKNPWSKDDTI